ncbi:MAG: nucleotidyl transferase AbiEii/AbiGii toxin family protein [Thermoflexales bacterium]
MTTGLVQSVHIRLIRQARTLNVDSKLVLTHYATERLLYRLCRSDHVERFVLKGGLMLLVWLGEGIRPTRDADLLGFGALDADALVRTFREICASAVEADGLVFDVDSVQVAPIRAEDTSGG